MLGERTVLDCGMRHILGGLVGGLGLLLNAGCGGTTRDAGDGGGAGSGGVNAGETTSTSGGSQVVQSSGGTSGTSAATSGPNDAASSPDGVIDVGFNDMCQLGSVGSDCAPRESAVELRCFSLAELNSPCAGTHLLSVHLGEIGEQPPVEGDGGTALCPSAEELFWGDEGLSGGCFDIPACGTPTVETESTCCYLAAHWCRPF